MPRLFEEFVQLVPLITWSIIRYVSPLVETMLSMLLKLVMTVIKSVGMGAVQLVS